MEISFKNITRGPLTTVSGAIIFFLTVYGVYNGTASLGEAGPVFLLSLWLCGMPDPKTKKAK